MGVAWLVFLVMLVISVVVHEVAHGAVASLLGDPTARRLGRLTLNPLVHLDWVGSLLVPVILIVMHSPVWFAWAKPVPISTEYLKNPVSDMAWIALAGPLSNVTLAFLAGTILRIAQGLGGAIPEWAVMFGLQFIILNIGLAVFNLLPIPPLDGSRILNRFLPPRLQIWMMRFEPYGIGVLLALSFFNVLTPVVSGLRGAVLPWFLYGI